MTSPTHQQLPVAGLDDLSNETRTIATPWIRMLRGIGLGQYPIDYDAAIADHLRDTFTRLTAKVPGDAYTTFSEHLADFVLRTVDPHAEERGGYTETLVLVGAVRAIPNPYYRALAASILMDAFAKLRLGSLLVSGHLDFPAEALDMLDQITPDGIADENQGRHGEYERVSASTAVFLAVGQLGLRSRLVTPGRNRILEALDLLERIPTPYFCGRAGGTLLSVIALLDYTEYIFDGDRDYMAEVLEYLTRADEIGNWPEFHNHITTPWKKVYPLLTMLNAVAMCGRAEYLYRPIDALAEVTALMDQIPWEIRVHMEQYAVIALHNLGRLGDQVPDLDALLADMVAVFDQIDPGENYSPRGNAFPYVIEVAMMTGRMHLVPDTALKRMADSFPDLIRTEHDVANRAFPVSYVVNILGEIGRPEYAFGPRARYEGASAVEWFVDNLSDGGVVEGDRITMFDHALISSALRLRGAHAPETALYQSFRFPFNDRNPAREVEPALAD
ncbi:hypothetical protein ACTJKO_00705 [Curtobacterium sp. 22159]|uniref:hypothetical protein n=1 Tax=Curtobacterium sp. 22159 TaxID=3453882 RepID=UPI003F826A77